MIDLKNTRIVNDKGELRELYMLECERQGIQTRTGRLPSEAINDFDADIIYCEDALSNINHGVYYNGFFNGNRLINLSDLKPRTKVVYEKVESCSDTQLASMFVDGLLYFWDVSLKNPRYVPITTLKELSCGLSCYRKVEKEIDWKGELDYHIRHNTNIDIRDSISYAHKNFPEQFIGMCHLVASLTDKPE